jgi:hypothetical protein
MHSILTVASWILALVPAFPRIHVEELPACTWSSGSVIAGMPDNATLRSPSTVTYKGQTLIAGNLVAITETGPRPGTPAIILTESGRRVPLPPGDFIFAYPKLIVDGELRLHLLWAHAEGRPGFLTWPDALTEVWHASYDGMRWSTPEKLLKRRTVRWRDGPGQVIADSRGTVHVIVPGMLPDGTQPVVHLRLTRGRWEAHNIRTFASTASLVSLGGDSLLAALVGVDTALPESHNLLMLARSGDRGRTWTRPSAISTFDKKGARLPLLEARDNVVHLSWLQSRSEALGDEDIRFASSRDTGVTWSPSSEGRITGVPMAHSLFLDRCGSPHAIVSLYDGDRLRLVEVTRLRDSLIVAPLFATYAHAGMPAVAGSPSRSSLIWTGIPSNDAAAQLLHSALASCECGRRGEG